MKTKTFLTLFVCTVAASAIAQAPATYTAAEAAKDVAEIATVTDRLPMHPKPPGGGHGPGGNPYDIQFNNSGVFGGNDALTFYPGFPDVGLGTVEIIGPLALQDGVLNRDPVYLSEDPNYTTFDVTNGAPFGWLPIFVGSHENPTNNTVVPGIYLDNSSPVGGAAPGFGIGIEFIASDTSGDHPMGNLNFKWTNVTHNSNVSAFDLQLDNGSTAPATVFSVAGNGDASFVGTLSAASAKLAGVTVANLPASSAAGQIAYVTDGAASLAWGETVTGGGSTKYLVWYNGANWTVAGK
jgi:hypothetical protein